MYFLITKRIKTIFTFISQYTIVLQVHSRKQNSTNYPLLLILKVKYLNGSKTESIDSKSKFHVEVAFIRQQMGKIL